MAATAVSPHDLGFTPDQIAEAIDLPVDAWAKQCHKVSLAIVRSGVLGVPARVARGWTPGVRGQHSWVVYAHPDRPDELPDCYDHEAHILDATLWSYDPTALVLLWVQAFDRPHEPHGSGSIFDAGRPAPATGPVIEVDPPEGGWSPAAHDFLQLLGPLDLRGWAVLANLPVGDWPAAEILGRIADHPDLGHHIPIDVLGMVTDRNPSDLYLAA